MLVKYTLSTQVFGNNGEVVPNPKIIAILTKSDFTVEGTIIPDLEVGVGDANGNVSVELVSNLIGTQNSFYDIEIRSERDTVLVRAEIQMPESNALLQNLVGIQPVTSEYNSAAALSAASAAAHLADIQAIVDGGVSGGVTLVNDLTTGGIASALTAEQGVALKALIDNLVVGTIAAADILSQLITVDGTGSGLDADLLKGKDISSATAINTIVLRDGAGSVSANEFVGGGQNLTGLTKTQVGLTNVTDTSDLNKPISTLQQAEFDLKLAISSVVDDLTSGGTTVPLSAQQGFVLKGSVDALTSLLASDNLTLDSLQEVVDYIVANRGTLDSLGIANVSGLQAALDNKQPLSSILTATTASFTSVLKTKLDGVEAGAQANVGDIYDAVANQTALDAKQDLIVISATEPSNPVLDMLWLDIS